MRLPGEPAIQTLGPATATAWKSKWSVTDSGRVAGGVCQLRPRSLVVIKRPPSPTAQPPVGAASRIARKDRNDQAASGESTTLRRTSVPIRPAGPARAPASGSRKSPASQLPELSEASGCQVLPASRVEKTPEGE